MCIYMCVHIRIVCVYSKKEKSHVTSTTYKIYPFANYITCLK